MSDVMLNVVVLGVLLVLAGGVFFVARNAGGKREAALREAAIGKGWSYERVREHNASGMRLRSAQWQMESVSRSGGSAEVAPGSSSVTQHTQWEADFPGATVLIGSSPAPVDKLGDFGQMLIQEALRKIFGSGVDELRQMEVGSEAFRKRYMVLAGAGEEVQALLTPRVERLLTEWKGVVPLIKRMDGKLSIELLGRRLSKVEEVLPLIELGEALLAVRDGYQI